jgi:hypothetical protein
MILAAALLVLYGSLRDVGALVTGGGDATDHGVVDL